MTQEEPRSRTRHAPKLRSSAAIEKKRRSSHEHKKHNARQDEFLSAALHLFAERNFTSVTIKDIANSLDLNTGLIYYYFKDKRDLLRASIDHIVDSTFENFRQLEKSGLDPCGVIDAWLESNVKQSSDMYRFVKIALDFKGAHEQDAAIEATISRFYAQERRLLSRVVNKGIEQGIFKPVDPNRISDFISTHLDGCVVRSVVLDNFDVRAEVRSLRSTVFQLLGYKSAKVSRYRSRQGT